MQQRVTGGTTGNGLKVIYSYMQQRVTGGTTGNVHTHFLDHYVVPSCTGKPGRGLVYWGL
jgi:hypothetical protein